MMTLTKISLALLVVAAVGLAAYGAQMLIPATEEKLVIVSPSPEINVFVGSLDKAKNVQKLQDDKFVASDVITIREITAPHTAKDSYVISGTVVSENTCPPCPKGSEGLCSPCPPDTFTIAEPNNDQLHVQANSMYKVKVGEKYLFTISGNTNIGWNLISATPQ